MSIFSELQEQGLTYFRTFDPKKELFLNWLNDFELAATMLQITDQRKVSFLLVMMKPSVYEQIRIQVHPYNPFELSYKVLTHQLEVMYSNNYGYSAARYRFFNRKQIIGESMHRFCCTLMQKSTRCNYDHYINHFLLFHFTRG